LDIKLQEQQNRGITAAAYPQVNASINTQYNPNVTVQTFPNFIAQGTYGVLEAEGVKNGNGEPITSPEDFGFIQAQFGTKWTASAGATLSQILFDGQVFVGLQARETSISYREQAAELTKEQIRTNIYKIYYQLSVANEQIRLIDANIARTDKLLSDSRELYKNGFAESLDVDRASVQLTNFQAQKQTTINNVSNGYLGLKVSPSTRIAVPRLADAPWSMECKTWKTIEVNGDRQLIMGEGINFHIRDELWDRDAMRVHMDRYHPVGRMFADRYCRTDDRMVFPPAQGAPVA